MTAIDSEYKAAHQILLALRSDLEQLETGQDASVFVEGRVATNIAALAKHNEALETLFSQLPPHGTKRDYWRVYVRT